MAEAAISPRWRELTKEFGCSRVERGVSVSAGFLCRADARKLLPTPASAKNENVLVILDPARLLGQRDHSFVQSAGGMVIDVLQTCCVAAGIRRNGLVEVEQPWLPVKPRIRKPRNSDLIRWQTFEVPME